jgi:general secretion pathway protein L
MARLIGIDIRATHVRAALLRTSYRRVTIERLLETDVPTPADLDTALLACVDPLLPHTDGLSAALEGEQSFIHRLTLPPTALKQLDSVLPYEVEAQIPVDIDELVYDHRLLRRLGAAEPVIVLVAAGRTETVRGRVELVERVLGRAPERMGVGPLTLANLASVSPELAGPGPLCLVDLGGSRTEVVILVNGEPAFARTLSRGVAGLPASAPALAGELRQTIAAWVAASGKDIEAMYLLGGGAHAPGAESYLAHELGLMVKQLPPLVMEGITPEIADTIPRFAKAISLAVGLSGRARDLDLRQGPLSYQRGFGFLKEKMPVLLGLAVAILVSFLFATWAELRTLNREEETLSAALSALTKEVLGQETADTEEASTLLEKAQGKDEADPMPPMDAIDVLVELSNAVPASVVHDIEEFDMQKTHVKVTGIVPSATDAQTIANNLKTAHCIADVKIAKVTQVINSDRQKYVLEFDAKCPEEAKKKKKPEAETEPAPE